MKYVTGLTGNYLSSPLAGCKIPFDLTKLAFVQLRGLFPNPQTSVLESSPSFLAPEEFQSANNPIFPHPIWTTSFGREDTSHISYIGEMSIVHSWNTSASRSRNQSQYEPLQIVGHVGLIVYTHSTMFLVPTTTSGPFLHTMRDQVVDIAKQGGWIQVKRLAQICENSQLVAHAVALVRFCARALHIRLR